MKPPENEFDPAQKATDALMACATGLKQSTHYCGIESNMLGAIRLQVSGGRLLFVASPSDAARLKPLNFSPSPVAYVRLQSFLNLETLRS